mgnify:CR=1 FL=1
MSKKTCNENIPVYKKWNKVEKFYIENTTDRLACDVAEDLNRTEGSVKAARSRMIQVINAFPNPKYEACSGCEAGWREKGNASDIEKTVEILRLVACKRDLILKYNMLPPVKPIYTVQEVLDNTCMGGCTLEFSITAPQVNPYCSGIYFLWEDGDVVYVGSSQDIRTRLAGHPKERRSMRVSWLPCRMDNLRNSECFYIWSLSPRLNGETTQDLKHSECQHVVKELLGARPRLVDE